MSCRDASEVHVGPDRADALRRVVSEASVTVHDDTRCKVETTEQDSVDPVGTPLRASVAPADVDALLGAPRKLSLPLDRDELATLRAGDACELTGPLFTLRDAGHARLLAELDARGSDVLPYGLAGQAIFYAGPTPSAAGRPFGAIGPTTSSRMDFAAPRLYDAGIVATLGKGIRSRAVKDACVRNGAVYFVTVGGAAAYLAKCVRASETLAYDDLGTEALRRIEVAGFPVFVGVDVLGNDIYELG